MFTDLLINKSRSFSSLDYYEAKAILVGSCKVNMALPVRYIESLDGIGFNFEGVRFHGFQECEFGIRDC
jgi:hypothetical protein